MNHPFQKSDNLPSTCAICSYDFLSHTKAARCSLCDKIGEVEIHDKTLKCHKCISEYETNKNNLLLDTDTFLRLTVDADVTNIRYSGDIFNAKTLANNEVKKKIFADNSLSEIEKEQTYFRFLADRYTHFSKVVFDASSIAHDGNVEIIVISNELRAFGDKVREETRNQIKQADEFYAPAIVNKPKVVPKVKTKISALDKMVNAMMEMTGKSETECRLLIEKGNFNKNKE